MTRGLRYVDSPRRGSFVLFDEEPAASGSHRLFIFVHGFNGGPESTWGNFGWMLGEAKYGGPADAAFFNNPSLESIENGTADLAGFLEALFSVSPFTNRNYDRITFVGHSQGCIVIRQLVLNALREHPPSRLVQDLVSRADVALFAPAHLGFAPSGALGFLFHLGMKRVLSPLLASSTSYVELSEPGYLLTLRDATEAHQAAPQPCAAVRPRTVFGRDEKLVLRGHFAGDDPWLPQTGQDHVSICKPTATYVFPLDFVFDRRS